MKTTMGSSRAGLFFPTSWRMQRRVWTQSRGYPSPECLCNWRSHSRFWTGAVGRGACFFGLKLCMLRGSRSPGDVASVQVAALDVQKQMAAHVFAVNHAIWDLQSARKQMLVVPILLPDDRNKVLLESICGSAAVSVAAFSFWICPCELLICWPLGGRIHTHSYTHTHTYTHPSIHRPLHSELCRICSFLFWWDAPKCPGMSAFV